MTELTQSALESPECTEEPEGEGSQTSAFEANFEHRSHTGPDNKWELDHDNDQLELARAILARKTGADGVLPVFDLGGFWRWDGSAWRELKTKDMILDAADLNSWAIRPNGKEFSVSVNSAKQAVQMAELVSEDAGYFEESLDKKLFGLTMRNGWVSVSPEGASLEVNSDARRSRHYHDVDYDPQAECPAWRGFLADVFGPDSDAAEKRRFLAQFLGACLTGQAHVYNKAVMLVGAGANGKSVLCDVFESLFPEGSVVGVPPHDMNKLERCATLANALLNLVTDIPTKDLRDAGTFKQVVSGDPIEGRRLYQNPFRFRPRCGHLFSANALPQTTDFSHGFFRRWVVIAFNRIFDPSAPGTIPRTELVSSLLKEKQGIMTWAINGAVDLMKNRSFFVPPSHKQQISEWRKNTDQVTAYLDERAAQIFDVNDSAPDLFSTAEEGMRGGPLYEDYREWAKRNGLGLLSSRKFGDRLKDLGVSKKRDAKGQLYGIVLISGLNQRVGPLWEGEEDEG